MRENIWLIAKVILFLVVLLGSLALGYSGYLVGDQNVEGFALHLTITSTIYIVYVVVFLMYSPYIIRFPYYLLAPIFIILFGLTGYFIGLAARFMDDFV